MSNHFTIVVRPEGDGPPAEIRLRRFLKTALRSYGLRCTAIGIGPDEPDAGAVAARPSQDPTPPDANRAEIGAMA